LALALTEPCMHVRLPAISLFILAASISFAQQSTQTSVLMSDRDKAGLRGAVKTVFEERTMSFATGEQTVTTTTKYAPDGRILEKRSGNSDGSEWVTSYTYYPDGRVLKRESGKAGTTSSSETTYSYDDALRLIEVKSSDNKETRYQSFKYDDKGRKSAIETLSTADSDFTSWEGSELGFSHIPGGTVTTLYNEQGVATGAQYQDAEGKLVGHIVRKFDSEGRVISEEQIADAPVEFPFPEEIRSKLNPEQMKSIAAIMTGAQNRTYSYSYDEHGRVKERHRSSGFLGDQLTITEYNDHGDKATERETTVMSPDTGPWNLTEAGAFIPTGKPNPPQPPISSETHYRYQYDQYDNWTEQTMTSRTQPDEAFRFGTVIRRKLTYY
jgi:YD repeat-containing protein